MFETPKQKKSQAKQSRSDVRSPNTNNLNPRTLQPYNLHVLEKANTEDLFLFAKVCRVSKVVVSQNKLSGLFFSPYSKCGT
jgi:hypothetical protein